MIKTSSPNFFKMVRAAFLSSIISPLLAGTLLSGYITGHIQIINSIFVLLLGICLHIATNVYNDIYDTLQGTDKMNINRNAFSGGSGVLQEYPQLLPVMFRLARMGLVFALLTTVVLTFLIDRSLRLHLWFLFLLSVFFSKYYTAAPVKLSYRGWGEISVWLAFGPMAILVAAVSQNVGFHEIIITAMPATGISTLSILLIGQMIDLNADKATGKLGIAARSGNKFTSYLYLVVQFVLCLDVIILALWYIHHGWLLLLCLIPYAILLPRIWKILSGGYDDADLLKTAAKLNVLLHISFSLLFAIGLGLILLLEFEVL